MTLTILRWSGLLESPGVVAKAKMQKWAKNFVREMKRRITRQNAIRTGKLRSEAGERVRIYYGKSGTIRIETPTEYAQYVNKPALKPFQYVTNYQQGEFRRIIRDEFERQLLEEYGGQFDALRAQTLRRLLAVGFRRTRGGI